MAPSASLLPRISLLGLASFWLLMLLAMRTYPGGNFAALSHSSHDFFANYWCDLLRDVALNGQDNERGATLARAGMAAMAAALGAFWLRAGRGLARPVAWRVAAAGSVSSLAMLFVACLPSDRFPQAHAPAVLVAGAPGFACGVAIAATALRRSREAPLFAVLSFALVVLAALNLALYVDVACISGGHNALLPGLQKLASFVLTGWITVGLRDWERPQRKSPHTVRAAVVSGSSSARSAGPASASARNACASR
jgi:hypothetical protein